MRLRRKVICSYLLVAMGAAMADETVELSPVEVRAQSENLEGIAASGSEGVISSQRLAAVPMLRPGEALEMVPGLIVTQHAGDGKANQYFLRGFDLDHGTDFATWVGGVPVNMPSHAHGQGYTDLNFLIPELVDRIRYRKGPYFAEEGDFSSAGSAHIDYFRRVEGTLGELTLGENGYARSLLAGSPAVGSGHLLYGLELFHNDGPWQVDEHYRKLNGVLRYSQGSRHDGWSVTGMAYRGRWVSTDQIAERAVSSGAVDRFGSLDPTTGGKTFRYSLAGEWAWRGEQGQSRASLWWLRSGLDLWSNFSYCVNGCPPGDQFKQAERRQATGFTASQALFDRWGGFDVENSFGVQGRFDRIKPLGLYATSRRQTVATVREDKVSQYSLALWAQNETRWTPWLRSTQGIRADAYRFDVDAGLAVNGGKASDQMLTPKLALVFGPWRNTEFYANYGHGFHSNDARGSTIRVDPNDGTTPVERVRPLVRTRGYELGLRSEMVRGWQSTLALWQLTADSELLFVGDAGTTEAARPSRRYGVEWTNLYVAADWLAIDADLAWSHARFRDVAPEGEHIPGAVATTANLGLTIDRLGPWFGALRLRYFGPRPLIEDNSIRSTSSALTNLRLGYKLAPRTQLTFDVYNLFDRRANDIEYWYESQLANEAAPVFDRHVHPTEPRTFRLSFAHRF
ncbi:MAG: TonB-dependent receptor [Betaproteobacteria bacterium HGW-Betaproteobacteria-12]|nr:MAG: TonB-dependent receptor [Betaproteobacteria bacterium HGW-Betaproteobacteria-12]